ncbi:MAG: hypothetical protein V1491_02325 [archaeon]
MNYEELKSRPVKQNGERSNHDFHLRLSKTEKERLIMLTESANYATMSQFLKDQLFRPDLHFKMDLILKRLEKLEEKNGKD